MFPVFANPLQPLIDVCEQVLLFFHDTIGTGWGLSIILLTVTVRLLLLPLTLKQVTSMQRLQLLAPEMKAIQTKYRDDKQRQQQEMMKFYKENQVNPFASCLPLLLQLPVFMSLFFLLNGDEFKEQVRATAEQGFLFIDDITEPATGLVLIVLMVLFIGSQMASTMVMSVTADKTQQRIMLLLPLVFVAFIPNFPAGLIVYWITTNFWTLGQQLVVKKVSPPPPPLVAGGKAPLPAMAGGENGEPAPKKKPPPPPRRKKKRRR
jgi:YidC/Oxa1 family membrane protein insertase